MSAASDHGTISQGDLIGMLERGELTLTDVVDAVVEVNGIIGVGLITLAEGVSEYITSKIKPIGGRNG